MSRNLSENDKVVVVMGPTGSGKSTFINYAIDRNELTVGHKLKPPPAGIRTVKFKHPHHGSVVFVDTPGFNNAVDSDMEILALITDWLVKAYKRNFSLAAIIYLHKIDDNRITGSLLSNLKLFMGLCGQQAMSNVIVATTMWSNVTPGEGEQREEELKADFLRDILANGGNTKRFNSTCESAWDIIGNLISSTNVRIQDEVVNGQRSLVDTEAGRSIRGMRAVPRRLMKKFREFFSR